MQVGNAVSPPLVRAVASALCDALGIPCATPEGVAPREAAGKGAREDDRSGGASLQRAGRSTCELPATPGESCAHEQWQRHEASLSPASIILLDSITPPTPEEAHASTSPCDSRVGSTVAPPGAPCQSIGGSVTLNRAQTTDEDTAPETPYAPADPAVTEREECYARVHQRPLDRLYCQACGATYPC